MHNKNLSCVLPQEGNQTTVDPYWIQQTFRSHGSAVVFSIIFLTGVPLNTYIIIAIVYKRLYSTPTYLLLLNLGVTDLLICLITILFDIIASINGEISFGSSNHIRCQVCKIVSVHIFMSYISFFNIMLISIERFAFFKSPLNYDKYISPKRITFALLVIWILSFCLALPPVFGYGDILFGLSCGNIFSSPPHVTRSAIYLVVTVIVTGCIVLVLIVTNVGVVCIAVKHTKRTRQLCVKPADFTQSKNCDAITRKKSETRRRLDKETAKKQLRFFQVFGSILIVNFITFIPAIVLNISAFTVPYVPPGFVIFVEASLHAQVILHPTVEVFLAPELRKLITNHCNIQREIPGLGTCRRGCFHGLMKCCGVELWQRALEKQLNRDSENSSDNLP